MPASMQSADKTSIPEKIVKTSPQTIKQIREKAYSVAQKRESHKDAYKPWTPQLDEELKQLNEGDNPISAIAEHFGRTWGAIISRLKKFNYFAD